MKKCAQLSLSIISETDQPSSTDSKNNTIMSDLPSFVSTFVFQCYVKSSLLDLPLSVGQLLGVSWKSKSIILKVKLKENCSISTLSMIVRLQKYAVVLFSRSLVLDTYFHIKVIS